jgi:hypothetical protein
MTAIRRGGNNITSPCQKTVSISAQHPAVEICTYSEGRWNVSPAMARWPPICPTHTACSHRLNLPVFATAPAGSRLIGMRQIRSCVTERRAVPPWKYQCTSSGNIVAQHRLAWSRALSSTLRLRDDELSVGGSLSVSRSRCLCPDSRQLESRVLKATRPGYGDNIIKPYEVIVSVSAQHPLGRKNYSGPRKTFRTSPMRGHHDLSDTRSPTSPACQRSLANIPARSKLIVPVPRVFYICEFRSVGDRLVCDEKRGYLGRSIVSFEGSFSRPDYWP